FQLRSAIMNVGGGRRITGFVGQATYRITGSPVLSFVYAVNLLADAAFFMGLGKKTSFGCGTVRRIIERG
ncbi:MAG: CRISPR system precrRNA processing endoribonuclease RAMP protein Cas6, partial [Blastocatellia bacterium]|nr:CRISPR system precrRNA processing endoribonuclease RAMP protein Cas6 [Blastocatellia bacterium]